MGGTSQDEQGSHSMDAAARMETTGGEGWGMMVRHWVFAGEELA